MKNEKDDFIKEIIFFVVSGIIITTLAYFIHVMPVKASEVNTTEYFPMGQNDNNFPMTDIIQTVASNGNISLDDYKWHLLVANQFLGYYSGFLIMSDDFVYAEINNDNLSFNLYQHVGTSVVYEFNCGYDFSWTNIWQRDYLPSLNPSSLYDINWSYLSDFSVWTTSNSDNAKLVINYMPKPPWETTEPNPFEDMPEDIPNTPPTAPTWDTDITVGENIGNLIKWLGDVVTYLFNNLKGVLRGLFDTIKKTIENAITTFYNNMKSLFEPFINKVVETYTYLTEEVNVTEIVNGISGTQIFQDVSTINGTLSNFTGFFTGITEPDTYILTLHLENIPILHCNTVYIDFSFYNSCKTVVRALLFALTTFSIVFTILDSLPNYINGGGDE